MEELEASPSSGGEHDLQQTAGRALWRQVRAERYTSGADTSATHQGPYETSYDVTHGYCSERSILRP